MRIFLMDTLCWSLWKTAWQKVLLVRTSNSRATYRIFFNDWYGLGLTGWEYSKYTWARDDILCPPCGRIPSCRRHCPNQGGQFWQVRNNLSEEHTALDLQTWRWQHLLSWATSWNYCRSSKRSRRWVRFYIGEHSIALRCFLDLR